MPSRTRFARSIRGSPVECLTPGPLAPILLVSSITLHIWDRECPGGEFRIQSDIARGANKRTAKTMRGHQECRFVMAAVEAPGDLTFWCFVRDEPHLRELIRFSIRHAGKNGQTVQVKPFVMPEVQEEIIAVLENVKRIAASRRC